MLSGPFSVSPGPSPVVALLPRLPPWSGRQEMRAARLIKSQTPILLCGSPLRLNGQEQTCRVRALMGAQAVHLCLAQMLSGIFSGLCMRGQNPGGAARLLRARLTVNAGVCFSGVWISLVLVRGHTHTETHTISHMHTPLHPHTHTHTDTQTYTHFHTHTPTHTHTYSNTRSHTLAHTHTPLHPHTHVLTHIHTLTHTYAHTLTRTQAYQGDPGLDPSAHIPATDFFRFSFCPSCHSLVHLRNVLHRGSQSHFPDLQWPSLWSSESMLFMTLLRLMTFVQLWKSGLFLAEHSPGAVVALLFILFICTGVTYRRRRRKHGV